MNYSSKNWLKKHNYCNLICIHILLVIYYIDYLCDFSSWYKFQTLAMVYLFVFIIHYSIINFDTGLKGL